jgi:thiol-disulfide isomerase/thioredoxin
MAAKPIVDRLESEFEGRLTVIRLNIQDPAGRAFVDRYGVKYTPTFVLLDAEGKFLWTTVGAVDPVDVRRLLDGA